MSLEARLDKIPNFLKAQTPHGLRRLMLRNNLSKNVQFVYHSVQFVNGEWFAWYYEEMKADQLNEVNGSR